MGLWLGCWWIACATAGGVHAQVDATPPTAEASAVPGYTEAVGAAIEHYSAHRWREAQVAFARAHELQPSARTYRGLGLAAYYVGEYSVAREAFEQALSDARRPLPEDQRREVVELLAASVRETGRFELRVAPASARVEADGAVTERRVLLLSRGEHAVSVSAEGHVPQHATLIVTGGEDRALAFALPVVARAPSPVAKSEPVRIAPVASSRPEAPEASRARDDGGRALTWIVAAAVPVFAGASAAVWLTGEAKRDDIEDDCARDRCDRAEADRRSRSVGLAAHETWATVSLAAAGVALVAASVLFVVEGGEPPSSAIQIDAARSGAVVRGNF